MLDTVGSPIFFPEYVTSGASNADQSFDKVISKILADQIGSVAVANIVVSRVLKAFQEVDGPYAIIKKVETGFSLAIFNPDGEGSGPEVIDIPPPPSYFTDEQVADCIVTLLSALDQQGVYVDYPVCQVMCELCGDADPLVILGEN